MNGNLVFMMLNDCLITVKSGNPIPINVGDFMPDYNLWYALKYMQPDVVVILDMPIISREYLSTSYFTAKIEFISKWLSQVIGVRDVYTSYSVDGSWRSHLYPESEDIISSFRIRRLKLLRNRFFIDNLNRTSEVYIKENHPEISYMDKLEFINIYNKNPRNYEKKT